MRSWDPSFTLDDASTVPIFLQIARAVSEDVRRGRLAPGARLPGSRTLASALEVHRNTVLAAYRELEAEGWIATRPAGGTFVSTSVPERSPRRFSRTAATREAVPARLGFELGPGPEPAAAPGLPRGTLALYGGQPDLRLVPAAALAQAYRRALLRGPTAVLGYGDPRGDERLRAALASMLSAVRGLAATADDVVVTRGSQQAIDLVARAIVRPGDVVAVEAFGYRPAWRALELAGARLAAVPVDEAGLSVDALEALAARAPVRAVYVTPHHQYPTTAVMAPGRRMQLLELARTRRFAVIEDDYDNEFHYEGRPVLPLASADPAGVTVYVGTLSKILAPGLRTGFVVAPRPLLERVAALRVFADRQGDHAVEAALAELLEDGELPRHARRMRRVYASRRAALAEALRRELGDLLTFRPPPGGMAFWARVGRRVDVDAWLARARAAGVAFQTGKQFAFDGKARPYVRLGFAPLDEREIRDAVRRMASAL